MWQINNNFLRAKYEGEFKNGKKNGTGKIVYEEDGAIYEGDWQNDQKHGRGKSFINGCVYIGGYKFGKRDGSGILTSLSGTIYEGEFKNDRKHGVGKLTYPLISPDEPQRIVEGIWEKDRLVDDNRPKTSTSVTVQQQTLILD